MMVFRGELFFLLIKGLTTTLIQAWNEKIIIIGRSFCTHSNAPPEQRSHGLGFGGDRNSIVVVSLHMIPSTNQRECREHGAHHRPSVRVDHSHAGNSHSFSTLLVEKGVQSEKLDIRKLKSWPENDLAIEGMQSWSNSAIIISLV